MRKKIVAAFLTMAMTMSLAACGSDATETSSDTVSDAESSADAAVSNTTETAAKTASASLEATSEEERASIEETLNLANNTSYTWSYDADADAWVMSIVTAVAYAELPDEQGVSVCIPGAYIKGIDTDGDGTADITADNYSEAVNGSLVIDYDAEITNENGETYTAATAPMILNTGAAGYSNSTNTEAATTYAADGYINIACGNRGKQDTVTDDDGNTTYTGDAPSCLVDQKNAVRFVKYNILLGNLPGNVDCLVSTGGSGGGAHATMYAATGDSEDFYDYEIECGAVGVYRNEDGTYDTSVTIDGTDTSISDAAWGCVAYSAITSLSEADMAMAFEYYLDADYDFNTDFQAAMAEYLSDEYMDYINEQNLSVNEADVGFDLNGDGDKEDAIALTIEYDETKYADTNGYGGTYLDLYLVEFEENLQWYLDNLDYAEGWTWFDEDGNALSDDEVAAMTTEDKEEAFIEGRYAKATSSEGGPGGGMAGGAPGGMTGTAPDGMTGTAPDMTGGAPDDAAGTTGESTDADQIVSAADTADTDSSSSNADKQMVVGTPGSGTTQSAGSDVDSSNYATYEEMLEAYEADIAEIEAGDEYGNNIVELYDPLNYINDSEGTDPTWTKIVCGAAEGDISMMNSLNLQIAWLNSGVDCEIEWQWDGGHVPSEIFGNSLSLYVDQMYEEYVNGGDASSITKAEAETQTQNGDATEATGTDLSSWVDSSDLSNVSFSLADAVSYRTAGASKATPGFDVIDYGQEDYEFGDSDSDARHWDKYVLNVLEEYKDELSALFKGSSTDSADDSSSSESAGGSTDASAENSDTSNNSSSEASK